MFLFLTKNITSLLAWNDNGLRGLLLGSGDRKNIYFSHMTVYNILHFFAQIALL